MAIAIFVLEAFSPLAHSQVSPNLSLEEVHEQAAQTQSNGTYLDWLRRMSQSPQITSWIETQITFELEQLRRLTSSERRSEFQNVFYYFSSKHQKHKPSAVRWEKMIESHYRWLDLNSGKYNSEELARLLMRHMVDYEKDLTHPLLDQISEQVSKKAAKKNIIFLGRDMQPAYLDFLLKNPKLKTKTHLLNVSRNIRDQLWSDSTKVHEFESLLDQLGLDPKTVAREGVVFVDSCMTGKIPRSILWAMSQSLTPTQTTDLIKKSHFIYVRSKDVNRPSLQTLLSQRLKGKKTLTPEIIAFILTNPLFFFEIPVFELRIPERFQDWEKGHLHNFFEHRPKTLTSLTEIAADSDQVTLRGPAPSTPSERIKTLLGFLSDLEILHKHLRGERIRPQLNAIERAAKDGSNRLRDWQDRGANIPGIKQAFSQMKLIQTEDPEFPWTLWVNEDKVFRLKRKLGEGRNVEVYLTENNTAIKITKDPKKASKNFLTLWAEGVISDFGIPIARTHYLDPHGLYIEQEWSDGKNLEEIYSEHSLGKIPSQLKNKILSLWKKAKKLGDEKDLWLDFKAANFVLKGKNEIVMVDYTPRLNNGRRNYFYHPSTGKPLTDAEFLDEFFFHDQKKENRKPFPRRLFPLVIPQCRTFFLAS